MQSGEWGNLYLAVVLWLKDNLVAVSFQRSSADVTCD